MKKYLAAAALVGAIWMSTIAMANRRGNYGYGPGLVIVVAPGIVKTGSFPGKQR